MKLRTLLFYLLISCTLSSCYYNRRLVYLQDKDFSGSRPSLVENKKELYRLQPSDVVSVQIKSSAESEVSGIFNTSSYQNGIFATPGNFYMEGYSVNAEGKITIPVIGDLFVKGLTLEETQKLIQSHANKYLTNSTVLVKLTSFKVTVLGEVKNPGYYYVYNNQATVLEALGMAGDLTNFGNRKNVKLIRQTPQGSEVVLLDLTEGNLLRSEYFFMMPGDVLYVAPIKTRSKRDNLELLTVVFAALTTTVLVMSYIDNQQQ